MDQQNDRRQQKRLDYQWPVWYSEDFTESMSQGLMIDISSGGIAFDCPSDDMCPQANQHLTVRFSIPRFEGDDPTATVSITRTGHVCRIEDGAPGVNRVVILFDTPLPLRPAEVTTLNSICGGRTQS
ncbi:MAG: PilZ domain-containing protein [Phycisphaerales bacterium]|nr:MAG: PilZ domain-containing protein [Phycisphaerales bacterium]